MATAAALSMSALQPEPIGLGLNSPVHRVASGLYAALLHHSYFVGPRCRNRTERREGLSVRAEFFAIFIVAITFVVRS
jgi:hypothetical protein